MIAGLHLVRGSWPSGKTMRLFGGTGRAQKAGGRKRRWRHTVWRGNLKRVSCSSRYRNTRRE